jgi:uroporphyrinogen III methyltransferase/synthase
MESLVATRGGESILFPTIETRIVLPPGQVDTFKEELFSSNWVVLTSVSGARYLMKILGENFLSHLSTRKVAAVGRKTAALIEGVGCTVHLVPDEGDSRSLAEALAEMLNADDVVFFPRAKEGRREMIDTLKERGFKYYAPVLYDTRLPEYGADEILKVLDASVEYATFTSPSTFRNFISLAGKETSSSFFKNVKIAVIGNTTAACVKKLGFAVAVKPEYPDVEELLDAISAHNASISVKEEG